MTLFQLWLNSHNILFYFIVDILMLWGSSFCCIIVCKTEGVTFNFRGDHGRVADCKLLVSCGSKRPQIISSQWLCLRVCVSCLHWWIVFCFCQTWPLILAKHLHFSLVYPNAIVAEVWWFVLMHLCWLDNHAWCKVLELKEGGQYEGYSMSQYVLTYGSNVHVLFVGFESIRQAVSYKKKWIRNVFFVLFFLAKGLI